jgi:RNA polymerase sigma factor (sigma-70 family)
MQRDTVTENTGIDEQLRALTNSDEKTLAILYKHTYPKVAAYIFDNGGSEEQAKDTFQEAFIAVWRNVQLNKFDIREGHTVEGYLFQVSKYKWIDYLRSAKREAVVSLDDDTKAYNGISEPANDDGEKIDMVRKHFAKLGDNCRDVLTRFYYNKQSLQTIAGAFGWTEQTAKNNKYRCLQKLRSFIKQ